MKLNLTLKNKENINILIERNWFTGRFTYSVNGKKYIIKSSLDPTTHFSLSLKKYYSFEVGGDEKYTISIEHTRPLLFAGFRPHEFTIFVNGKLHKTYKGY